MAARAATRTPHAGESAPAPEPTAEVVSPTGDTEAPVRRAGGHVDRGDGRGWVLEIEE